MKKYYFIYPSSPEAKKLNLHNGWVEVIAKNHEEAKDIIMHTYFIDYAAFLDSETFLRLDKTHYPDGCLRVIVSFENNNEGFDLYLKNSKIEFVNYINSLKFDTKLRTACEDFIIAFDQLKYKYNLLEESQKNESK